MELPQITRISQLSECISYINNYIINIKHLNEILESNTIKISNNCICVNVSCKDSKEFLKSLIDKELKKLNDKLHILQTFDLQIKYIDE